MRYCHSWDGVRQMKKRLKNKSIGEKGIAPIFAVVSASFLLAIAVSIYSLAMLARENTKEIDTMLTYRIYDSIASSLNEPIIVSKTMACDGFLKNFLMDEEQMGEQEAVETMKEYLSGVKTSLEYDSAFLVSEKSHRYYTYEGLNKIVDPEHDAHDIWYSLFLEKGKPYDLDVDVDEVNHGQWTVFVNARLEDEQGRLIGVCGVGVQMTNLQELFLTSEREYGVKINLVDKNGLVQVDTEDINIENAWLDDEILSKKETDEYVYQTTDNGEFAVAKYVEYLGWYLVVRSAPTAISGEFVSIILLNVALFLIVMAVLIFAIAVILKHSKKERDDREKLLIASERAVAASEAKSSFLSSMSHEIRTPLNAVLGMNEMILREAEDERILEYSTNIQNAGKTLLYLINSILDFSKIEEGKMEIVPVPYGTSSVINNLAVSVMERAKDKGLEFIVEVDEKLPSVMLGDDVRLSQVIMNLLTNAVKYTEHGCVRFIIRTEDRSDDEISLYIAVEDTGIGIRKEDMPKLFESFERLDEVKNHSIEGTGLGMSIVVNLLKLMGSEIHVESEYGKGSKFWFIISQKVVDGTPIGDYSKRLAASRKKEKTGALHAPLAKVLVVDDNEMNLKVAKNLLGLFGIRPDMSESGYQAIDLIKEKQYNLILLDHMMPKMDGKETLARMKAEKLLSSDTRVIALTANAVNGARENYLASGFDDYLSKPIEIKQLEDILIKWLPEKLLERAAGKKNGEADGITRFEPEESATMLPDWLSDVNGLDVGKGLANCGTEAIYLDALTIYAKNAASVADEIESYRRALDAENATIKVHALKSTSRTIGAEDLGALAERLELAGKAGDAETLFGGLDGLLARYRALGDRLAPLLTSNGEPDGEEKPLISDEELRDAYDGIREFAANLDVESVCYAMDSLNGYRVPETERERVDALRRAVSTYDWDRIHEILS